MSAHFIKRLRLVALLSLCGLFHAVSHATAANTGAGAPSPSASANTAYDPPPTRPPSERTASLGKAETEFVSTAVKHSMAELAFSKLAQQKASNPEVKQFADRMVQDHSRMYEELKQLAARKGVRMPLGPDNEHENALQKLHALSGARFDREYMKRMVEDHKHDADQFRKSAKSARDPDVKAFAAKAVPVLEEHLKLARSSSAAR